MKVVGLIIAIILCIGLSAFIVWNIVEIVKTIKLRKKQRKECIDVETDRKE